MVRNYTMEDVENLRAKGGVSYEEAIRLLDKYDGDLASALIELEKCGHLDKNSVNAEKISALASKWWNLGLKNRVLIERKDVALVNLPVLIAALLAICAPRTALVSAVLLLVLGGRVSLQTQPQTPPEEASAPDAPAEEAPPAAKAEKPADGFDRITIE